MNIIKLKPKKYPDFTSPRFCDVCLHSMVDEEKRYASKHFLNQNSIFFQTLLEDDSKDMLTINLDARVESIERVLQMLYSHEIDMSPKSITRGEIGELIYILHYLDIKDQLQNIIEVYKKTFFRYGPINVDDINNIHFVFNAYPDLRKLYFKHHLAFVRDKKVVLDYNGLKRDILQDLLMCSIFDERSIYGYYLCDNYGQPYVLAKDRNGSYLLGVILAKERYGTNVHFFGWKDRFDEIIKEEKDIYPLVKDGLYICPETLRWTEDSPNKIFIKRFKSLTNAIRSFTYERGMIERDLAGVPDIFRTLPEYKALVEALNQ